MSTSKNSSVLADAEARLIGLKTVDATLDFGNDRSVAALDALVEQLRTKIAEQKAAIAAIEAGKIQIKALEKEVSTLSSQMLRGVEFEFGQNSSQYEIIGGVTTDERLRRARQTILKNAADKNSADKNSADKN